MSTEIKNLKLIKHVFNNSLTTFTLRDDENKDFEIDIPHIKENNKTIYAMNILLKMYNTEDCSKITFVRGIFFKGELIDIGHLINSEWLKKIMSLYNNYSKYFKFIISECNDILNHKNDEEYSQLVYSTKKKSDTPNKYIYGDTEDTLIIYNKNIKSEIKVKFDSKYYDYLSSVYWHFSKTRNGPKMYISGDSYGTGVKEETVQHFMSDIGNVILLKNNTEFEDEHNYKLIITER